MSYFRLLNPHSVEKALLDTLKELNRTGVLSQLPALVSSKKGQHSKMVLDGFNLFNSAGYTKPYTWFLSKPKIGIAEFLRIYEEVANYPLHGIGTVGEVAAKVYPQGERKIFLGFKKPNQWLSPSMLLAASAQYLGVESLESSATSASMRLGNGWIKVSPVGCHSNFRHQTVHCVQPDFDPDHPITTFPDIAVDNPILKSLYELCDEGNARYGVTVAALALKEGLISKAALIEIAALDHPLVTKCTSTGRDRTLALAALQQCEEILDQAVENVVEELFEAAVPQLLSFKAMQSITGAPTQVNPRRSVPNAVRNRWRSRLREAYKEV